ncbi:ABC transporter substrate-binding protein [Thermorudis peleae]|uniref:ABC transporter substrate-binding protein n=1 Tax=Thermorudis peleae TaxID=1382356 RepID=UPI00068F2054|nr:ABC transporter substrate-binding protein [Thermorudis peleae]
MQHQGMMPSLTRCTRRAVLRWALGAGLSSPVVAGLLAACGSNATPTASTSSGGASTAASLTPTTSRPTSVVTVTTNTATAPAASATAVGTASPVALNLPKVTPEKTKITFAVGGQEQFIYLPLTLAKQLGYFQEQGIDVTIANFSGGSKAAEALVGGSADFVMGFYDHTIQVQPKGQYLQSVCLIDQYPGIVLLVSQKAADKIKTLDDLKGKTVGVTAPGSSTQFFLNFILSQHNIPQDAVSVVAIGTGSTAYAAIAEGKVDAGMTVDPAATQLVQDGKATVLWDTRSQKDTVAAFGGPYPAGCFYSKEDFIKNNPQTVQALVNAGLKTLAWIQSHSAAEIADKMPPDFYANNKQLYVSSLQNSLTLFSPNGLMPADGPATVRKVLALSDASVKNAQIDLNRTYTNQFVQAALGK